MQKIGGGVNDFPFCLLLFLYFSIFFFSCMRFFCFAWIGSHFLGFLYIPLFHKARMFCFLFFQLLHFQVLSSHVCFIFPHARAFFSIYLYHPGPSHSRIPLFVYCEMFLLISRISLPVHQPFPSSHVQCVPLLLFPD